MIKVLIVEDDPMVAEFNRRYLKQIEGFELVSAVQTGDQALKVLQEKEVDLILLDIFLPGINGLELLAKIRETGREADVILVTAARDVQTIKKALKLGAVDYLVKPFEFERFKAALTAYRETHRFIRHKDELSQDELDRLFAYKEQAPEGRNLPKGLDRKTLGKVWEAIQQLCGRPFSTDELSASVGISRVSIRKYLEFLTDLESLSMEVEYGAVGRPIYKYRCLDTDSRKINLYITN